MRLRHWLAATTLLAASIGAHAEHFQYAVSLTGTYSAGGTEGCFPPDFNQPACPRPGYLGAMLSFDTPSGSDGSYSITGSFGDITDFSVSLGSMTTEALYGGVNLDSGVPNGTVQALDQSESFTFDWATKSASYVYDYGYHEPNGSFSGTLTAVPEQAPWLLFTTGMIGLMGASRRFERRRA